jgi:hypothetical protein
MDDLRARFDEATRAGNEKFDEVRRLREKNDLNVDALITKTIQLLELAEKAEGLKDNPGVAAALAGIPELVGRAEAIDQRNKELAVKTKDGLARLSEAWQYTNRAGELLFEAAALAASGTNPADPAYRRIEEAVALLEANVEPSAIPEDRA